MELLRTICKTRCSHLNLASFFQKFFADDITMQAFLYRHRNAILLVLGPVLVLLNIVFDVTHAEMVFLYVTHTDTLRPDTDMHTHKDSRVFASCTEGMHCRIFHKITL